MAKRNQTPEERVVERLKDMVFTTLDGRELKVGDHFKPEDFAVGEKSDEIFIKHVGLMRVLKKLFFIRAKTTKVIQPADKKNEWCTTVEVQYVVIPKVDREDGAPVTTEFLWSAVADCNKSNAMPGYSLYTTTNAETRASGRAIRQMLGVDFCTQEEVAKNLSDVEIDDSPMEQQQLMIIETKFMGQYGITIDQIRGLLGKTAEELPVISPETVTRGIAAKLINTLNSKKEKLIEENTSKNKDGK